MTNVVTATGQRIWSERSVHVHSVRRFDPDAGKTQKGVVHFWEMESTKEGFHRAGQHRAVDVEDIINVSDAQILSRDQESN